MSADSHPLLAILDCPACRKDQGLIPQILEGRSYVACPLCRFWYPVRDEVVVLLAPNRNPDGLRRPLGEAVPLPIERRPVRFVDFKALTYSFYIRMQDFGTAFGVDKEPIVVDVGCSTGSLAAWLHPEQTYIGLDLFFEALRFARRASGQFFVQADAEKLPVKTASVSFFASREVLEHLTDPPAAVRELCRIGRRGVIVVPTLDFPFLYDPINWLLVRRGRRAKFGIYGYGHQRLHDIVGWRQLLEDGGLTVKSERPIGTGLFLNAFDVVWHSLFSWRDFDSLPRWGAPIQLARWTFSLRRALHRVDDRLYAGATLSQAFEVVPAVRTTDVPTWTTAS